MGALSQEALDQLDAVLNDENTSDWFKLKDIVNKKFRIVKPPIIGKEYWVDNKPYRVSLDTPYPDKIDTNKFGNPAKSNWWGLAIYVYEDDKVGILGVTQTTIQRALRTLDTDEDWGDFTTYDVKVMKSIENERTVYHVMPQKPSELSTEVKNKIEDADIDLQKLITVPDASIDPDDVPF